LIGFEHLNNIHFCFELSKVLKSYLVKYGLEDRVLVIITDNVSNNKTLLDEM
jgi:hypothetical protein